MFLYKLVEWSGLGQIVWLWDRVSARKIPTILWWWRRKDMIVSTYLLFGLGKLKLNEDQTAIDMDLDSICYGEVSYIMKWWYEGSPPPEGLWFWGPDGVIEVFISSEKVNSMGKGDRAR